MQKSYKILSYKSYKIWVTLIKYFRMTKRPHSLRNAALQAVLLDGNRFGDLDHIAVNRLVHGQCNVDIVVNDLVTGDGNNTVVDALVQQINGVVAHQRGVHAVTDRRGAAALDVAQNGCTGVNAGGRLDLVGQLLRTDNALGHDDNEVLLARDLGLARSRISRSKSNGISGSRTATAPVAIPTFRAI